VAARRLTAARAALPGLLALLLWTAPAAAAQPLPDVAPVPGGPPVAYRQVEVQVQAPDGRTGLRLRAYDPVDDVSRSHGLMGVTDLPADAGMLFRWTGPRAGGFWMLDTPLPLSIAFADEHGVIVDLLDMEPCPAAPCPSYRPAAPYVTALEVNRGVFAAAGVAPGWRLALPSDLPHPPHP